jgi:DNA-binding response OmpR family regulator
MDKLIFVVDDEKDIRELVSVNLKLHGFKIKEFENGNSMLENIKDTKPDLIILDVMMPGIDGITICNILKNNVKTSNIPVILLTVKGQIADIEDGFKSGADFYIVKPFSPLNLVEKVMKILKD